MRLWISWLAQSGSDKPINPTVIYFILGLLVLLVVGGVVAAWWNRRSSDAAFDRMVLRGGFEELRGQAPDIVRLMLTLYYRTLRADDRLDIHGLVRRCAQRRMDGFKVYLVQAEGGGGLPETYASDEAAHRGVTMVVVDGLGPDLPEFLLRPSNPITRSIIGSDMNALPRTTEVAKRNHVETHDRSAARALLLHDPPRTLLASNRHWHLDAAYGAIALHCEGHLRLARQLGRLTEDAVRIAQAFRERLAAMETAA
ncbi:MAG: hypothetical protein GVY24_04565 [Planctomycetes bacterium]|jgi:hypothetical protein|nr:hypothetical protein [Planctomycetota bacterium]